MTAPAECPLAWLAGYVVQPCGLDVEHQGLASQRRLALTGELPSARRRRRIRSRARRCRCHESSARQLRTFAIGHPVILSAPVLALTRVLEPHDHTDLVAGAIRIRQAEPDLKAGPPCQFAAT